MTMDARKNVIFSVSDRKYLFRANLVHKIKIASLDSNLEPRPIQICRIQWWRLLMIFRFFSFLDGKHSFGVNLVQKFKTFSLRRNSMVMCHFSVLDLFLQVLSKKFILTFWFYLINLAAVYTRRLETSGFSCS